MANVRVMCNLVGGLPVIVAAIPACATGFLPTSIICSTAFLNAQI